MKMKLVRTYGDAYSTNGTLFIHGIPFCETMESPKHGSVVNRCLPPGEYKLMMVCNDFSSFCPRLMKTGSRTPTVMRPGESYLDACGNILVGEICTGDSRQLIGSQAIFDRLIEVVKEVYVYGDRRFSLTIEESPEFEYVESGPIYIPRKEMAEWI